jgi:hypothetical protein
MGLDQRQGQLSQLAHQLFETAMFLSPLFDLGKQIHRDVSGLGFGFHFPGEVMAGMLVTLGATAMGIAAEAADGHEAGGENRASGLELFLAGLEEPADQRGMLGYFHFHTLIRHDLTTIVK